MCLLFEMTIVTLPLYITRGGIGLLIQIVMVINLFTVVQGGLHSVTLPVLYHHLIFQIDVT